jgi:hypothetical protein
MAIGLNTLVLSPNFSPESVFPLSTLSAEEAIVKVLTEKFDVLYYYDRPVLTPSRFDLRWPSVVVSPYMPKHDRKVQMKKHFLFLRDHGRCIFCTRQLKESEVTKEHIIPTSKGGKNTWTNVGVACLDCNSEKGDSMPTGKWTPKSKAYEPTYFQLIELRKKYPVVIDDVIWKDFLPGWSGDIILRDPTTGNKTNLKREYIAEEQAAE